LRAVLRALIYVGGGPVFIKYAGPAAPTGWNEPAVYLGADFDRAGEIEIPLKASNKVLTDVRMLWVRWAVCRWLKRSAASGNYDGRQIRALTHEPLLHFPTELDASPDAKKGLCRRRGGVPLTRMERFVLRHAFKFRRKRDEG
jgi:hypothetical protein